MRIRRTVGRRSRTAEEDEQQGGSKGIACRVEARRGEGESRHGGRRKKQVRQRLGGRRTKIRSLEDGQVDYTANRPTRCARI